MRIKVGVAWEIKRIVDFCSVEQTSGSSVVGDPHAWMSPAKKSPPATTDVHKSPKPNPDFLTAPSNVVLVWGQGSCPVRRYLRTVTWLCHHTSLKSHQGINGAEPVFEALLSSGHLRVHELDFFLYWSWNHHTLLHYKAYYQGKQYSITTSDTHCMWASVTFGHKYPNMWQERSQQDVLIAPTLTLMPQTKGVSDSLTTYRV